jgi:hypothetical protein
MMLDIRRKSQFTVTTKTAMEIAAQLTTGLYSPIYRQIDPLYLGEAGRAMQIAERYGERLDSHSQNLKEEALHFMVRHYPEHGFVIDRREAEESLFKHIRDASIEEIELLLYLGKNALVPEQEKPTIAPTSPPRRRRQHLMKKKDKRVRLTTADQTENVEKRQREALSRILRRAESGSYRSDAVRSLKSRETRATRAQ